MQREHSSVKELKFKISQQEEIIGGHEADISRARSMITELQRENKKLLSTGDQFQKLQDEYDAMKLELEKQSRKANTADKYLQKLQATQLIEKDRDLIKLELDDMRKKLSSSSNARLENLALQKTNDEVSRTLAQIEREHEELRVTNKQLRISCESYGQQIEVLNERGAQDQEIIADLKENQARLASLDSPMRNGILENELSDSSAQADEVYECMILLRWNRLIYLSSKQRVFALEKENVQIRSEMADQKTTSAELVRQLEATKAASADHLLRLQRARDNNLALQTSLTQVQQGHPIEGLVPSQCEGDQLTHNCESTQVFRRMRDQVNHEKEQRIRAEESASILRRQNEDFQSDRMFSMQSNAILSDLLMDTIEENFKGVDEIQLKDGLRKQANEELRVVRQDLKSLKQRFSILQAEHDRIIEEHQSDRSRAPDETLPNDQVKEINEATSATLDTASFTDTVISRLDDQRGYTAKENEVSLQNAIFSFIVPELCQDQQFQETKKCRKRFSSWFKTKA